MPKLKLNPKNVSDSLIFLLPFLKKFRKTAHSLIEIEIDSNAIIHNALAAIKFTGSKIAPVLKSNAYGHGLIEVAKILEKINTDGQFPFFVVDSYFEALTLRQTGVKTPILIIGYSFTDTIKKSRLKDVAFTITSIDALKELAQARVNTSIHIKIDTGMHRQGIEATEINEAIDIVRNAPTLNLEGITSHLADAHNSNDNGFTKKQIEVWNNIVDRIIKEFPKIKYVHLTNTSGTIYNEHIRANVNRFGLGLYGFADRPELESKLKLKPALRMKSVIAQIKHVKAGQSIGYNCAYKAKHDMYIAIVPTGYNEGIDRRLSNTNEGNPTQSVSDKDKVGVFQVNGVACPIVGLVSMNMTTIDVTDLVKQGKIKRDDEVIIVSNNPLDPNSIRSISLKIGAIPYENLIKIPDSLRRIVK